MDTNDNNDELKKKIEEEGTEANPDNGELDALEPASGAEENGGPSEEELPEETDHVAEENEFPSEPAQGPERSD
jgi:hypothetical protein